jgi:hypothetical protein
MFQYLIQTKKDPFNQIQIIADSLEQMIYILENEKDISQFEIHCIFIIK